MRRSRARGAWVSVGPCIVVALLVAGRFGSAAENVHLARGSTWRFLKGLAEPSSPDTGAWRQLGFDDAAWETGRAPFGYNENDLGTDLNALTPPMRYNYSTLYLRQVIEISQPDMVNSLVAKARYDDGFLLWINGRELVRQHADGSPGDHVPFNSVANRAHEAQSYDDFPLPDPKEYLAAGPNLVAVQVINTSMNNTDLVMDLELTNPSGPDVAPPQVTAVIPPPGITVRTLESCQVLFNEEVTGINAADLLVNGTAAKAVAGSGAGPYEFSFAEPSVPGAVELRWAADHGITDSSQFKNPFAGGSWTYTLDPQAPPPDVVINEFMASNVRTLLDEDSQSSDWIEIYNRGDQPVSLMGWSLTDTPLLKRKWVFPAILLGPKEFLIVFASGKDRKPTGGGNLHANFLLDQAGDYLALHTADSPPGLAMEFAPRYPDQRANYSYGLSDAGEPVYFVKPSPGKPNEGETAVGIVPDPTLSVEHGVYADPFAVELSTETEGATIYYRMDPEGRPLTPENGTEYTGEPIPVEGKVGRAVVWLRAMACKPGYLPSNVVSASYIFPQHVLRQPQNPEGGFPSSWRNPSRTITADYAMDQRVIDNAAEGFYDMAIEALEKAPSLSIFMDIDDLFGTGGIYVNADKDCQANQGSVCQWEKPCSAELIFPGGRKGFQVNCGIRMQGQSSRHDVWKVPKLSFRLVFRSEYGPSMLRFPVFADSRVQRFQTLVLDAKLNQVWYHASADQHGHAQYVRELFCDDVQNLMGSHAAHDIEVNLFLNGLHWGLYNIHERCDHDFAASYLAELDAPETPGVSGEDYDCIKHEAPNVINPDPPNTGRATSAWSAMYGIAASGAVTNDRYIALQEHLDVADFCDYILMNLYVGNTDWAHKNWYATHYSGGGPWRFHSWDAEHTLKIGEVGASVLNYQIGPPTVIFNNLRNSSAEFRLLFGDHVHRHFFNGGVLYVDPASRAWDPDHPENNRPAARYMKRIEEIDRLIVLESARWGDYRKNPPYTRNDWLRELNGLLAQYFPNRSANALNQLRSPALGLYPRTDAPVFSRHGGLIEPGFALEMSLPGGASGAIHYTTDGSDPRVFGAGEVSPAAMEYAAPIPLSETTFVRARTLGQEGWSAVNEALFTVDSPILALRVSELMYHPPPNGMTAGDEYEFIELRNTGNRMLELTGVAFTEGIRFRFAEGTLLRAGEFLVLASNEVAFGDRYPGVRLAGTFEGRLDNDGDTVTLRDADGGVIVSFFYRDGGWWPREADGAGHSLVVKDPAAADLSDPASWAPSSSPLGTPGEEDSIPLPPQILENPTDVTVSEGSAATFAVRATGNPAPTYQWQLNGVDIAGATGSSYTTAPLGPGDDGSLFRCLAVNPLGSAASREAKVTVLANGQPFRRGDANGDSRLNVSDAVRIIRIVFDHAATNCEDAADANDDGIVAVSDAIALLAFEFLSGAPEPPPPFKACGHDPTLDNLTCETHNGCR